MPFRPSDRAEHALAAVELEHLGSEMPDWSDSFRMPAARSSQLMDDQRLAGIFGRKLVALGPGPVPRRDCDEPRLPEGHRQEFRRAARCWQARLRQRRIAAAGSTAPASWRTGPIPDAGITLDEAREHAAKIIGLVRADPQMSLPHAVHLVEEGHGLVVTPRTSFARSPAVRRRSRSDARRGWCGEMIRPCSGSRSASPGGSGSAG